MLLSLNDFAIRNNWEHTYEGSQGWNTFITSYGDSLTWDLKSSFAWNLHDDQSEVNPENVAIHFNPYIDLYGYWFAEWWAQNADNWWLNLSFTITPFNIHLIETDVWLESIAPFNLCTNIGFN